VRVVKHCARVTNGAKIRGSLCPGAFSVPRICLNMIVKDEAPVIERCLRSVKPWIDHWVIVDTGSSDGTQAMIRKFMADLPGVLHERPWRDFAHNRNQAMALARERMRNADDFLLFIDADETLRMAPGFAWPQLDADGYQFRCELDGWQYLRNALVCAQQPWRWEGVLHEYLTQDAPHRWAALPEATIVVARDGARARAGDTYLRDISRCSNVRCATSPPIPAIAFIWHKAIATRASWTKASASMRSAPRWAAGKRRSGFRNSR